MSLSIKIEQVSGVYVAGYWHNVADNSFDLDSYEFYETDGGQLIGGGTVDGVCDTGFRFRTDEGELLVGPMTAIMALRIG